MAGDPYSFAESGPAQATSFLQAQKLNNLAMEKTQAETQHYQALAQQEMQKAAQEKQQAELQKKQQDMLQRIALESKGKSLTEQIGAQASGGMLVGSMETTLKATQALNQLSQMDSHEAQAQEKRFESLDKFYTNIGRRAESIPVGDQAGYNQMIQQIEQATGKPLPDGIRNAQWTEENRNKALDWIKKSKEGQDEARANAKEAREKKESEARIKLDEAKVQAEKALTAERVSKTEKTEKVGGKAAVRTPREDVKLVSNLMKNEFPGMAADDPGAAAVAELVAEDAQNRLAKNKGLSRDQAITQAYEEAKKNKMITSSIVEEHRWTGPNGQVKTPAFNPTKEAGDISKDERAASIKKDYQDGKLTREQAAAKLKAL